MADYQTPPAIAAVSLPLCDLALCEARLMDDTRYPWIVLIPRLAGVVELEELPAEARARLMEEAVLAGQAVRDLGEMMGRPVEKLNVASLGNVTAALHLHVTGRRADDYSWPSPCYGLGPASPWPEQEAQEARRRARLRLEPPR